MSRQIPVETAPRLVSIRTSMPTLTSSEMLFSTEDGSSNIVLP
jgi:hypothetical protein